LDETNYFTEEIKMTNNGVISANDPRALEKLTNKLEGCKKAQEYMKEVNAYFRGHGTCKGFPDMPEAKAAEHDAQVTEAYSWEKQPFPGWRLQNNNAEIRRLEKRIHEITYNKEVGFSGWEFNGGHAEANTEMNRLQLFFDEKPDERQRTLLKSHGFNWAPSQAAWQRQLNDNAVYAAGRLDFIKPADGRTVREHQPKAPARDDMAR
jgi:hypothetical protein